MKDKKNILVLGSIPEEHGGTYTTGVTNVVWSLVSELASYYNVTLFATNYRGISKEGYNNVRIYGNIVDIKHLLLFIILHPCLFFKMLFQFKKIYGLNPFRSLIYYLNIKRIIDSNKFDLIHLHGILFPVILSYIRPTIPVVTTLHGIFYPNSNNSKLNNRLNKLFPNAAKHIQFTTYLNSEMQEKGGAILKLNNNMSTVIPNGVNTDIFYFNNDARKEIRSKFNIKQNDKLFLTVASIQKRKGQELFIDFLFKHKLQYKYILIGKGPDFEKVKAKVNKYKMNNQVFLIGYVNNNELFKYYSASDLYAHVSTAEGQALSEIEAFSTGLRVLLNSKITNTVASFPNDNIYYVVDIEEGTFNIDDFCQWSNTSYERITRNNYSWQNVAKKYSVFFNKIINAN